MTRRFFTHSKKKLDTSSCLYLRALCSSHTHTHTRGRTLLFSASHVSLCTFPDHTPFYTCTFVPVILTMNIQANGILRFTNTVLIVQLTCVVAHIGAKDLLYFQTDAIHIAAIHSIAVDNNWLAVSFPAKIANVCKPFLSCKAYIQHQQYARTPKYEWRKKNNRPKRKMTKMYFPFRFCYSFFAKREFHPLLIKYFGWHFIWQPHLPSDSFQCRWIWIVTAIQVDVLMFGYDKIGRWCRHHRWIWTDTKRKSILMKIAMSSPCHPGANNHMSIRSTYT